MANKTTLEHQIEYISELFGQNFVLDSYSNGLRRVYQLYVLDETDGSYDRQIGPSAYSNEMECMIQGMIEGSRLS